MGGRITLADLDSLIQDELKNLDKRSEDFKSEIKSMISRFSFEITEKIPSLKLINLDKRKEDPRLKGIVMENLFIYISYLEKLIDDLAKIDEAKTNEYILEVQSVFNRFNKNSKRIFEKATIFIGKELADVRDIIKKFAKEFNEKIESNKEIPEKKKLIEDLKSILNNLEDAKKIQKQIGEQLLTTENKIAQLENEKQLTEKDYEDYKKSKEYGEFLEEQEKIKQENKIANESAVKLKQEIDLKFLSKHFHEDAKKSRLIKEYSENFINSLKNDNNLEIISILKQANQNIHEEKIREIRKNILEQKIPNENKKLREFEDKKGRLEMEIAYEKSKFEHEKDKKQKFEEKQKQILEQIKEKVEVIWKDRVLEIQKTKTSI